MITIQSLTVEGFKSIVKKSEFSFENGIHILSGKNGTGKTTVFDALYFSLFGKSIKGTSVQSHEKYGCKQLKTVCNFTIGNDEYSIERTITNSKNQVVFLKNCIQVGYTDKRDLDRRIIEVIGISESLFKASCFIPQKSMAILALGKTMQRTILSELLDLSWLDVLQNNLKDKKMVATGEYSQLGTLVSSGQTICNNIQNQIQSNINRKNKFQDEQEKKLNEKRGLIINFHNDINQIKNRIKELVELDLKCDLLYFSAEAEEQLFTLEQERKAYKQYQHELKIYISTVDELNRQIARYTEQIEKQRRATSCIHCLQPLNPQKIEKAVSDLQEEQKILIARMATHIKPVEVVFETEKDAIIAELKEKRRVFQEFVLILNSRDKDIEKCKNNKEIINQRIKDAEQFITDFKNQEYSDDNENLMTILSNEKAELKIREFNLSTFDTHLKLGEIIKLLPNLREFTVNSVITQLNKFLTKYTTNSEWCILLKADGNGIEPIILDQNGNDFEYEALSGGEQQILDLSLTLALNEYMSQTLGINLLFLDEVFTNLDAKNLETSFDLLTQRKGQSIWVVSHTPIEAINAKHINIEKNEFGTIYLQ